jgi:hypothetical protein
MMNAMAPLWVSHASDPGVKFTYRTDVGKSVQNTTIDTNLPYAGLTQYDENRMGVFDPMVTCKCGVRNVDACITSTSVSTPFTKKTLDQTEYFNGLWAQKPFSLTSQETFLMLRDGPMR